MATPRRKLWMVHARPFDPSTGLVREVWLASEHFSQGDFGSYLTFTSTPVTFVNFGDVLDVGNNENFAVGTRFRTSTLQNAILIGKGIDGAQTADGGVGYFVGLGAGGSVRAGISDGTRTDTAGGSYDDGEWHVAVLIAFVADGNRTIELYVDGALVNSDATATSGDLSNTDALRMGLEAGNPANSTDRFIGDVERALFFSGAPSITDIDPFFDEPLVVDLLPSANPDVDGAWQATKGRGVNLEDSSGSGFDGLISGPSWTAGPPKGTVPGVLTDPHSVRASILSGNVLSRAGLPSFGDVTYANPDGRFDEHLEFSWHKRSVETRQGFVGDTWETMDLRFFGEAEDPDGDRDEIRVPLRGFEDRAQKPLQTRFYEPGFEPYVVFDGVDDWINFGDNLDRGTVAFIFGVAFRTSAALHSAGLYTKKPGIATVGAGYALNLGSGGVIRLDLADGDENINISHTPAAGYNTGERISVIGQVQRGTDTAFLYVNLNDGSGWTEVGSADISTLGSVDNVQALAAGSVNSGGSAFFDGEIERLVQTSPATGSDLTEVQDALDERYPEDVDASTLDHFVPLTENTGTSAGDLSPNGFDGTLNNTGPEEPWSGFRNGTRDLEGKPVPIMMGQSSFFRPILVDPIKLIWQISDRDDGSATVVFESGASIEFDDTPPPFGDELWEISPGAGQHTVGGFTAAENSGNAGVFVRLGSDPTGEITVTAFTSSTEPDHTVNFVLQTLLQQRFSNEFDGFLVGRNELIAATSAPSGFNVQEPTTLANITDRFLEGPGFHWTVDPRDPVDSNDRTKLLVFQSRDLTGETPDATINLDEADVLSEVSQFGFEFRGRGLIYRRVTGKYLQLTGHQPIANILQAVDLFFRLHYSTEWRQVSVTADETDYTGTDPALRGADEDLEFESAWSKLFGEGTQSGEIKDLSDLRDETRNEALRRLALHAEGPEIVELELTEQQFRFWLGDVLQVNGSRFGLGNGKLYLVVGVDDDANASGSRLTLWGGFDSA